MEKLNTACIIPSETELNPDGFFLGQLVCPKKNHVTKWSVAKLIFLSRFDLSVGPVLNLVDIQTGSIYQELPGYVDFLASKLIQGNENLCFDQLVCPIYSDDTWSIGSIQGILDSSSRDEYIVLELGAKQRCFTQRRQLSKVVRVESSFPVPG